MLAHLAYASTVYLALGRGMVAPARLARVTAWSDVLFATAIALVTEGTTSPFHVFFAFALVALGFRAGLRRADGHGRERRAIYLVFVWVRTTNFYLMRPVYLAIAGYLTAYLGEQRLGLETQVHQLETAKERNRIARALHDGCVQTLAGVNLALESCRHLVGSARTEEALLALRELQASITREHDELRTYVRELAEVEPQRPVRRVAAAAEPRFVVTADFAGSGAFVDQVLQILREAITNVKRHANASSAVLSVRADDAQVHIAIDDDGVGFADPEQVPWSMASRVTDVGGVIRVARDQRPGAHLRLALPEA